MLLTCHGRRTSAIVCRIALLSCIHTTSTCSSHGVKAFGKLSGDYPVRYQSLQREAIVASALRFVTSILTLSFVICAPRNTSASYNKLCPQNFVRIAVFSSGLHSPKRLGRLGHETSTLTSDPSSRIRRPRRTDTNDTNNKGTRVGLSCGDPACIGVAPCLCQDGDMRLFLR